MEAIRQIYAWALTFMTQFTPLNAPSDYPEARETPAQRQERYEKIIEDMVGTVYKPTNQPLLDGEVGRARTLILFETMMAFESFFRRDVELGLGKNGRGDHGKSVCLMQINTGGGRVRVGEDVFTASDLLADRKTCLQAGYTLLQQSWHDCRVLPPSKRLSEYISGNCRDGYRQATFRWDFAVRWVTKNPPPVSDENVMQELHQKDG